MIWNRKQTTMPNTAGLLATPARGVKRATPQDDGETSQAESSTSKKSRPNTPPQAPAGQTSTKDVIDTTPTQRAEKHTRNLEEDVVMRPADASDDSESSDSDDEEKEAEAKAASEEERGEGAAEPAEDEEDEDEEEDEASKAEAIREEEERQEEERRRMRRQEKERERKQELEKTSEAPKPVRGNGAEEEADDEGSVDDDSDAGEDTDESSDEDLDFAAFTMAYPERPSQQEARAVRERSLVALLEEDPRLGSLTPPFVKVPKPYFEAHDSWAKAYTPTQRKILGKELVNSGFTMLIAAFGQHEAAVIRKELEAVVGFALDRAMGDKYVGVLDIIRAGLQPWVPLKIVHKDSSSLTKKERDSLQAQLLAMKYLTYDRGDRTMVFVFRKVVKQPQKKRSLLLSETACPPGLRPAVKRALLAGKLHVREGKELRSLVMTRVKIIKMPRFNPTSTEYHRLCFDLDDDSKSPYHIVSANEGGKFNPVISVDEISDRYPNGKSRDVQLRAMVSCRACHNDGHHAEDCYFEQTEFQNKVFILKFRTGERNVGRDRENPEGQGQGQGAGPSRDSSRGRTPSRGRGRGRGRDTA